MDVVVCGSLQANGEAMQRLAARLKAKGYAVTQPMDVPFPGTHDPSEKSVNVKFYYSRIDSCDIVVVCTDKDHVGFETACEIGYTLARKKALFFTHASAIDGVRALLNDGRASMLDESLDGLTKRVEQ